MDSTARQATRQECALEIVGAWKAQSTAEGSALVLAFGSDGWVSVLERASATRVLDFSVAAQASYRLDSTTGSPQILFETRRGNDVFPPGRTKWDVADYSDTSLVTRDRETGERSYWDRVQTHRYFMTVAAPSVAAPHREPALVMWTRVDGRTIQLEALGAHVGSDDGESARARFGRIPRELAGIFATEPRDDSRVLLRLELSEAQYRRSHAVYASWDTRASAGRLPAGDPHHLLASFLRETIDAANRCTAQIALPEVLAHAAAEDVEQNLPQQILAFIHRLKSANADRHVSDDEFPFAWEPPES